MSETVNRPANCPCAYVKPCHPMCHGGGSSIACRRCISAGNSEQKLNRAKHLAEWIDFGSKTWIDGWNANIEQRRNA